MLIFGNFWLTIIVGFVLMVTGCVIVMQLINYGVNTMITNKRNKEKLLK